LILRWEVVYTRLYLSQENEGRLKMPDIVPKEKIASKIIIIRDTRIMFDRDLAELYGVETRVLNQAVRRNIKRFPEDFMFVLTREEIMRISQIVTSSKIKYSQQVHAFTEQGVAMFIPLNAKPV